jgi:hypothetical protein
MVALQLLCIALLHLDRNDEAEARAALALLPGRDSLAPTTEVLVRMVELVLAGAPEGDWDALEPAVRALATPELLREFRRFARKR